MVMPSDDLIGIALEGLSPADQTNVSEEAIQIADATFYYGKAPEFHHSTRVVVTQFKYSVGRSSKTFRASDAKKTIEKFSTTYLSLLNAYGAAEVKRRLSFEVITNRPISPALQEALGAIASGAPLKGDAQTQAEQIRIASGLSGKRLSTFASKISLTGKAGSLRDNNQLLESTIVNCSATNDAVANSKLGEMRRLLREKAGSTGEGQNVITRTDVLACLRISEAKELLPCQSEFPTVGRIVPRAQLAATLKTLQESNVPVLVHAAGGVGKTVFIQSLADALATEHKVLVFDCFGGGNYRSPDDSRHLPNRGLIHIVNTFACQGCCDPILPGSDLPEELIRAFRKRMTQVVAMLKERQPKKGLFLFIDAIDNAAEQAKDKGHPSFPTLLLESIQHGGPIEGFKLVVSCRTERRDPSWTDNSCQEVQLLPFNKEETKTFLKNRIKGVTNSQIDVAFARSGGNPRILDHLTSDRGLLEPSDLEKPIDLETLLEGRISHALKEAKSRGYKKPQLDAFLAGFAVLPPPVPVEEYALAHGIMVEAVESFASDLYPLLEKTKHGLTFRDEPTETFVKAHYAAKESTLRTLVDNLTRNQNKSVYAANTLPGLLTTLDETEKLFSLAFDTRFPDSIKTKVGQQYVRHNRLLAAIEKCAKKGDKDRIVQLLVEVSTLAAVNQRGTAYIIENPDLVVATNDVDATRRLFATKTPWPGTRHSRLTIAHALSGDIGESTRHAKSAEEWIHHHQSQDDESRRKKVGPTLLDRAAVALCIVAQERIDVAIRYVASHHEWAAFEVTRILLGLVTQAVETRTMKVSCLEKLLKATKSEIGFIAAAIASLDLHPRTAGQLLQKLGLACKKCERLKVRNDYHGEHGISLQHSLLKAAAIAVGSRKFSLAESISAVVPESRRDVYAYTNDYDNRHVSLQLLKAATAAASKRRAVSARDILPSELNLLAPRVSEDLCDEDFRKELKVELDKEIKIQRALPIDKRIHAFERGDQLEQFIDNRLMATLETARSAAAVLACATGKADKQFLKNVELWFTNRAKQVGHETRQYNYFFDVVGREIISFIIWARPDLSLDAVKMALEKLFEGKAPLSLLVNLVSALSRRTKFQRLAGETAVRVKNILEREDEVDTRASVLADLARAIMPANKEEAAAYFRIGLEQMDAIGSGDYEFTNELLHFASTFKGKEMSSPDFHTLANLVELNMGDSDKMPWEVLCKAFAKAGGKRAFARFARWHDRDTADYEYSLLPFLKSLVEDGKMDGALATVVCHLAKPVELRGCGTAEFAVALKIHNAAPLADLIKTLIDSFERNHPDVSHVSDRRDLSKIAKETLGENHSETNYLTARAASYERVSQEANEHSSYSSLLVKNNSRSRKKKQKHETRKLLGITKQTDPLNHQSMSAAVFKLRNLEGSYDVIRAFFEEIRCNVKFNEQSDYLRIVTSISELDIYPKIHELKRCKELWGHSSTILKDSFTEAAYRLIRLHVDELISHNHFSIYIVNQVGDLAGLEVADLAIAAASRLAEKRPNLSAPVWLGLAAAINSSATEGVGQVALQRLLQSGATQLSSKAVDGPYKEALYHSEDDDAVCAHLIRQSLGSEWASRRWRAAHTVRVAAQLGKWSVVEKLFACWSSVSVSPYQAAELPFYHHHSKTWALIALARLVLDHPDQVIAYKIFLHQVASGKESAHLLQRHFAAYTLLQCAIIFPHEFSKKDIESLMLVGFSNLAPIMRTKGFGNSFYQQRPANLPEPKSDFYLDYDFNKFEVCSVANAFDKTHWEVGDAISQWIRSFDSKVKGMYDSRGRAATRHDRYSFMNAEHHGYGQYLAFNGLYEVAGNFLGKYPTVVSKDDGNPWSSWFHDQKLSRSDGFWLSDGLDRPPLEIQSNLLDTDSSGKNLTSSKERILSLLGIGTAISGNLVLHGSWPSADGIEVSVSSALVPVKGSIKAAGRLAKMDPFHASLPFSDPDASDSGSGGYSMTGVEWIIRPSISTFLDKTDSWGSYSAINRPRFSEKFCSLFSLRPTDRFERSWADAKHDNVALSEAWGCHSHHEHGSIAGSRLSCSRNLLKRVLKTVDCDLLLLVILRRYEKGYSSEPSRYWHTTAVVRVQRDLKFKFFPGASNKLSDNKY